MNWSILYFDTHPTPSLHSSTGLTERCESVCTCAIKENTKISEVFFIAKFHLLRIFYTIFNMSSFFIHAKQSGNKI
jgi:hypothetical protein